ncbi:MAG: alpha/beta fold hydrolase [Deltaproteobacteria bacterium]|nr:alpha/beta fold hydrolase [Deltaproteobacteria bacterium]
MTAETEQRRLGAIMFTDIVGYTSLTEADEAAAVTVRDRHRKLVRTLVEQFEGELVEAPGDESLSLFPSALTAVDCALAIQASLRDDRALELRIGIHIGDVLRRGAELIGEGVNLAARLRPLAEPGGICVSDAVWRLVASRAHLRGRLLGATALKNVSEAVEVYAIDTGGASAEVPRRRRLAWVAGIGLALLAGGYALYAANRPAVLAAAALYMPLLTGGSIEQQLGMTTSSDGVRIAYATTGEGPPIVYVLGWATHLDGGLGSPLYDIEGLLPMSSRDHLFVRYDGRGFGLSDRDVNDFSLDARVADLEAVVDALALEQVAIYAVSSGGMTGITYAARHPERVTRLVLASTNASFPWMTDDKRITWERTLDLFESDWENPSVANLMVDLLSPQKDGVTRSIISEFLRRSGDGPAMAGYFRAYIDMDVREDARRISVPTLVVHARDDPAVPLEGGRDLAALIPGARFEIVDGFHGEGIGSTAATRARILEFFK